MADIARFMRDRYDLNLSQSRSDLQSLKSLKFVEGEIVWIRTFAPPTNVSFYKALTPKFILAKLVKIFGPTSALLETIKTKKTIKRHLVDIYKRDLHQNFSNLFSSTLEAARQESGEIDVVTSELQRDLDRELNAKIPENRELNGNRSKSTREDQSENSDSEKGENSTKRVLRPRKKVDYKE